MQKQLVLICLTLFLFTHQVLAQTENSTDKYESITENVNFETEDNIIIYGDLAWLGESNPTIVLFHQGGSNARGEYQYTLPRLYELGYNILAVDMRRGGELYGYGNRTIVSNSKIEHNEYTYCDAQLDMQTTLNYILKKAKGKIILIGSSYSATLSIRLAAEYKDRIDGVLAFSPASGGPMADCLPDEALGQVDAPILVLRPGKEMEIESVQKQFDLVKASGKQAYVAKNGVHGSSMLVEERVKASTKKTWSKVLKFLKEI